MRILFSPKIIIASSVIALVYIIISVYLMNFVLVKDTLLGDFPLQYKMRILLILLQGLQTAMPFSTVVILILTALLTGINLSLVSVKLASFRTIKNVHFVVGGGSLIGIVGSGCAACGLPILSLLGFSGSIMNLPFHGTELSYFSLLLLLISFYILIRSKKNVEKVCSPIHRETVVKIQPAIEKPIYKIRNRG